MTHKHQPVPVPPDMPFELNDTEKMVWFLAFVHASSEGKGEKKSAGNAARVLLSYRSLRGRVNKHPNPNDAADLFAQLVEDPDNKAAE